MAPPFGIRRDGLMKIAVGLFSSLSLAMKRSSIWRGSALLVAFALISIESEALYDVPEVILPSNLALTCL